MFRKLIVGLVAAASLLTIALAPTAASAKSWGFGGGWGFHHHHHHFHPGFTYVGGGYGYDGCYVTRPVLTPFGYRRRIVNVCGY